MNCENCKKAHAGKEACFSNKTSAQEKGKKFIFEFQKEKQAVCCVKVDGCLLNLQGAKKCDYVFIHHEDYHFVELKGQDLNTAFEQLTSTISHFKNTCQINKSKLFAYIVASAVPKASTKAAKLKEAFKKHGNELKIATNQHTELIK